MSSDRRIDFVAPPFAGHLYPALDLARRLRDRGLTNLRVLTTAGGARAASASGLPFVEILPGRDAEVWAIANTRVQVGSNPLRMWRQVESNLALMQDLRRQLRELWSADPPQLVLADFVVPVAGLTAQSLGIPWWTGMPSPCALETPDGVPAYLGGWRPRASLLGTLRDAAGRTMVRTFKKTSAWLFQRPLRELGIDALYRSDGTEVLYSPDRILAYGLREFEFERSWPPSVRFIGPLTAPPPFEPDPLSQRLWVADHPHVLVTLGTHLQWARDQAIRLIDELARLLPETVFHFSQGEMGVTGSEIRGNVHLYCSIPYDAELGRYAAAIVHGGTGVTYACLQAGVPMLVWPHDYDQFDHAARIVHHRLGLRLRPSAPRIAEDLQRLQSDESLRPARDRFRSLCAACDPAESFRTLLVEA